MIWIIPAFLVVFADAVSNIIDSYLSNTRLRDPVLLLFIFHAATLALFPLLFLYRLPVFPEGQLWVFALLGLLEAGYLVFYLMSLKEADISVVASLFSIGKILVPVLAFFIVGEELLFRQYVGFFVVILCATALTTSRTEGKFSPNKALFFMIASSLLHAASGVTYKYVLQRVDWLSGFFYISVFSFLGLLVFLVARRTPLRDVFTAFASDGKIILSRSLLGFGSGIAEAIAISLAPITLVKAVYATQPFFVLLFAIIFGALNARVALRETLDMRSVVKKIMLFLVMGFVIYYALL